MIAIIDYEMGNKYSVINALRYIGEDVAVTRDHAELRRAERYILPGVGAFGAAMDNLNRLGLLDLIHEEVRIKGKPFMGICLGMQLLADEGEEKGLNEGLGLIPGRVVRLTPDDESLKLPHVGWNDIEVTGQCPMFRGLKKDRAFYFVHSYHYALDEADCLAARCDYGGWFTAAVWRENVFATQFHPEKSQKNGLTILENYAAWKP